MKRSQVLGGSSQAGQRPASTATLPNAHGLHELLPGAHGQTLPNAKAKGKDGQRIIKTVEVSCRIYQNH